MHVLVIIISVILAIMGNPLAGGLFFFGFEIGLAIGKTSQPL